MTDQPTELERERYMQSIISRQKFVDGFVIGSAVGALFTLTVIVLILLEVLR